MLVSESIEKSRARHDKKDVPLGKAMGRRRRRFFPARRYGITPVQANNLSRVWSRSWSKRSWLLHVLGISNVIGANAYPFAY